MNRGYDLDDADIAVRAARAMAPSTHRVLPVSELNRLVDTARAAEAIDAAKRARTDVQNAFLNGRARGIEMALRFQLRWWVCAAIAFVSFTAGRFFGAGP